MLKKIIAAPFILLSATSCSLLPGLQTEKEVLPLKSVEVLISRGSLMGADYEQYKIEGRRLYFECGQMKRGRPVPENQKFVSVSSDDHTDITEAANQFNDSIGTDEGALPEAGSGTSAAFADPGRCLMTLVIGDRTIPVKTSVDGITAAAQPETFCLNKLISLIRGSALHQTGQPPCGRATFFGIGTTFVPPTDIE